MVPVDGPLDCVVGVSIPPGGGVGPLVPVDPVVLVVPAEPVVLALVVSLTPRCTMLYPLTGGAKTVAAEDMTTVDDGTGVITLLTTVKLLKAMEPPGGTVEAHCATDLIFGGKMAPRVKFGGQQYV
jgi:hypothetical protein